MSNNIVQVNVTQTIAPAPSTLQRTGALLSMGGTTEAAGSTTLLTQLADLTAILRPSASIATLAWSGGTVTATTSAPHGLTTSDVLSIVIAGATPVAYNGVFECTITGASTFTYALVSNPGSNTLPGTYNLASASELLAMGTTFFAQGTGASVYVLELGKVPVADAVAALATFIIDNTPQIFYSYLVPRAWADEADYLTFLASFESTTAKTYFFTTMTNANYTDFTELMKDVFGLIEAPAVTTTLPAVEFSCAAPFYHWLNNDPSTTNKVAPFAFRYLFGVTAYPIRGNSALFAVWKAAGVNWVGTGAEGGISNTVLLWGTTMDGRDATYWYSVDWAQINLDLDLSNEIINGSNNPINPLYYNQEGINRLQARAQGTMNRGISYGLVLSPVVVNAVPFVPYVAENESDYIIGKYAGLSVSYTPARGFTQIVFNVNVTDFPTA